MNRPTATLTITAILVFVLACVFFIWLIPNKNVNTLYVANNGMDSNTCGDRDNPCRSVSQAIAHAKTGNTIEVGPGRYGDLNKNGTFGEPGEEPAQGYGMINVDKPVTLISSDDSFMTVLDADGTSLSAVSITANDVVFGQPKHGFLIVGAKANGLSTATVSNITVAGNTALANGQGGLVINGSANLLQDNFASGNLAAGIAVFGSENEVRNNTASSNGSQGFVIVGTKHVIRDNVASNNITGFGIQGTEIKLLQNTALGNKSFGISIDTQGAGGTISNNNIYGNNSVPVNGLSNCGIQNASGSTITATDNFWGISSGPGSDPADNAGSGSGCDLEGSNTIVIPFAEKSYSISK
ncbi:MAG: right-handed parallel beta-helix repeat-containing protein [Methylobacter sp.]|uniref:right-handed parallel beta-helix repeat-containing protein n=1 Tax=Methylobacter sp. TaxID=2051955 RepID=UPI00273132E8|nr:right-handed parallel beta-helix repeat-containing protein [Methylobacter sp.]MDP1665665.1 right-handed parallel beta-helix repeat-containing protein [Methylobacter sp.]